VKNSSSVIYASIEDTENIVFRKKLNYKHNFFLTFTDFFSYLLDEEEKQRSAKKLNAKSITENKRSNE
jgi:hypothetical protein